MEECLGRRGDDGAPLRDRKDWPSLYLGRGGATSSFGAAGSVVLLLLWVYYASCILFYGAEFTEVYARRLGHNPKPSPLAEATEVWTPQGRLPAECAEATGTSRRPHQSRRTHIPWRREHWPRRSRPGRRSRL